MQSISQKTLTRLVLKTVPSCKFWAPLTSPLTNILLPKQPSTHQKKTSSSQHPRKPKNIKNSGFQPNFGPPPFLDLGGRPTPKADFSPEKSRTLNQSPPQPTNRRTQREKWLGGRWVEKSKWEITIVFIYIYTYTIYIMKPLACAETESCNQTMATKIGMLMSIYQHYIYICNICRESERNTMSLLCLFIIYSWINLFLIISLSILIHLSCIYTGVTVSQIVLPQKNMHLRICT